MNNVIKIVGRLFVGVLGFLVVGIGVTEALARTSGRPGCWGYLPVSRSG